MDALFTVGVGFTVIEKLCVGPWQLMLPLVKVGVTVIVAITGTVPVFNAVKEGIVGPDPLAARPMLVVLFVQE